MIITVTMNPAIDKTIELDTLVRGGLNRVGAITVDAGGKGINVSKTISALEGESLAIGFLGGTNGKLIQNILKQQNIPNNFVTIEGETRINTKIVEADGTVTELNETGPEVVDHDMVSLMEKMEHYLHEDTMVILSGSVPAGVSKDIYEKMTQFIHEKGAKVFLDADGELLNDGLRAKPDVVKPNKAELERYVGRELEDEAAVLSAGKMLLEEGVETVIISLGAEGAYFLSKEHTLYSPALPVKTHSTVGAGDAMVAAFAYGREQELSFESCAKLAVATSAGAVMTVGTKPPSLENVEALLEQVKITKIA